MRRRLFVALAAALTLTGALTAEQKAGPDVELQRAIRTETVDGNLKGAIQQYQQLSQSPDRAVAAQALLRLGQCHEKLGNAEARNAYEQLLRNFDDQKDAASQARARLAALALPRAGVASRKAWGGSGANPLARVSPDGRYLSYVDWNTGELAVHDLVAGTDRPLTNKGNWAKSPAEFAGQSTISRDGKQVAYEWSANGRRELRVAQLPASGLVQPKTLFEGDDIDWVAPYDWSPDDKWIAAHVERKDGSSQLVLVSSRTGAMRVLLPAVMAQPTGAWPLAFFSPDGRFLAVSHSPGGRPATDTDAYVLDLQTGKETRVAANPGRDTVMGWSPNGRYLLIVSDRTGGAALWAIEMAGGETVGAPMLVRPDVQDGSLGISATGALYVLNRKSGVRDIHVASIDFGTGAVLTPPSRPIETFIGSNSQPEWSGDGKFLAYKSARSRAASDAVLAIRSAETGETRELRPNLSRFDYLRWAADGLSFVGPGTDADGRQGIYRIDARTGAASAIVSATPGQLLVGASLSADGQRLYYEIWPSHERPPVIVERELASGAVREVCSVPRISSLVLPLSPDGRYIALYVVKGDGIPAIDVVSVADGAAREVWRGKPMRMSLGMTPSLAWTADSRAVLTLEVDPGDVAKGAALWLAPVDRGQPRKLGLAVSLGDAWLSVHPDGRRIAYLDGEMKWEVWALENFLAAVKSKEQ